ncbi:MAG: nucleotidyltransferase domain-containing protein, partial [Deltaproteobacteria bacterium]|nr:nucleotidyltransferase domain-containing protein [Deltaproteobacteria bacterium]
GEAGPYSDVDFLVRLEPGTTLLRHAALARELSNLIGRDVQVVSEKALRQRIRDRVIREAVPL